MKAGSPFRVGFAVTKKTTKLSESVFSLPVTRDVFFCCWEVNLDFAHLDFLEKRKIYIYIPNGNFIFGDLPMVEFVKKHLSTNQSLGGL